MIKNPIEKPAKIVRRLLIYGALVSIAVLVLLHFLLFRPFEEALKLLLPSILASIITSLLIYAFSQTLLEEADKLLTRDEAEYIAAEIVEQVVKISPSKNFLFYERWQDINWQDMIGEAREIDLLASYMDTWIIHTAHLLRQLFGRGGSIRAILPKPDSKAACRVIERFPEYNSEIVLHKIRHTAERLKGIREQSKNKEANLDVYWTQTFCMHCLLRVDKKWLIISPFEHFRRDQIESPAFIVNLHSYPRLSEWVEKELEGFHRSGELWNPRPE